MEQSDKTEDHNIYIARIKNGAITEEPECIAHRPNKVSGHHTKEENCPKGSHIIPFKKENNENTEPIIVAKTKQGNIDIFIDSGAEADVIPINILHKHYPEWKSKRIKSRNKLRAANNKEIKHQGRVSIQIKLQNIVLDIKPFVTNNNGVMNAIILGYKTQTENKLITIPGKGILTPLPTDTAETLAIEIKKNLIAKITASCEDRETTKYWEARPIAKAQTQAYQHKKIILKPKGVSPEEINANNGKQILVRDCHCITTKEGECNQCKKDPHRVQLCTLVNGHIEYTLDNSNKGYTRLTDPKTIFYIDFTRLYKLDNLADTALKSLNNQEFEVNLPVNPYTQEECIELFQKTKAQVTEDLRSMIAEPGSWSLTGYREPTLKAIDHKGNEKPSTKKLGPKIKIAEFDNLNPCEACQTGGEKYFCNVENTDCKTRLYYRHDPLPKKGSDNIQTHNQEFNPEITVNTRTMILGCLRKINKHDQQWKKWFKQRRTETIIAHNFGNAVITEVSKIALLQAANKAKQAGLQTVHITNFEAYGISKDLLSKCFPKTIKVHIYKSQDIKVAGPGSDPRKSKTVKTPRTTYKESETQNKESIVCTSPGLPNTTDPNPEGTKPKNEGANILTEDKELIRKTQSMLRSHKEVFAESDTDPGQYKNPETGLPYLFNVRLKSKDPVIHKSRWVSLAKEKAAENLIAGLLHNGIIKRRWSNYNSQSVYVPKKKPLLSKQEYIQKGGRPEDYVPGMQDPTAPISLRHTVDYSKVNDLIEDTGVPVLSPKQIISRLHGQGSCAVLDISSAYHALTLTEESQRVTGFDSGLHTLSGRFCYTRSAMGMKSSASWLSAALQSTLATVAGTYFLYCDDLIITGKDDQEVFDRLSNVLRLLTVHGWKIKMHKLTIYSKKLKILGLQVDMQTQEVSLPREELDAVLMRTRPANPLEMKQFLGSVAYAGTFLAGHAHSSAKLHRICRKDVKFEWNEENLKAYEHLLELYAKPGIYNVLPNYDLEFIVVTDASEFACGMILAQITPEGKLHIIEYHSHLFDERASRQPPFVRESQALLYAIHSFYDKIAGHPTTAFTDSRASVFITAHSSTNSRVSRWNSMLSSLEWLKLKWISAKTDIINLCDYLSRQAAGSKEWVNQQVNPEIEEAITEAANKLKRDYTITMKNHTFMLDWLCKQPGEEIKKIENNSVYIEDDGHLHYTPIEGTPVKLDQNEQARVPDGKGQTGLRTADKHPAFTLKSQDKTDPPGADQEIDGPNNTDLPELALEESSVHGEYLPPIAKSGNKPRIGAKQGKTMPDMGHAAAEVGAEAGAAKPEVGHAAARVGAGTAKPKVGHYAAGVGPGAGAAKTTAKEKPRRKSKKLEEATAPTSSLEKDQERKTEPKPVQGKTKSPNRAQTGRCQPDKDNDGTSLYHIRRLHQNDDNLSLAPIPDNVMTLEEAEDANIFAPATQNIDGPTLTDGTDHPKAAGEEDAAGKFLMLCFEKSPNMRLSTLIEQQRLDPALKELIVRCEKQTSPVSLEGAEYSLKEGVLIRKQTKGGIEHYQICLPAMVAYNLAMKMHTGGLSRRQGRITGPSPHGGPRKLYAMFAQRFHTKKLAKLCKHIHEACDICQESKTNHAKKREDMVNSIYTPTGPATAWAIDLLSLPKGCLLVAVDLFSRFIVALPLYKEATSEHLWELFSTHILGVHGRPRVVIADNAPNISGTSIQQVCAMLSIELRTTPAYSPRSNITELANKHILLALRLYHANYKIPYNKWRISLPSIVSGINFAPFAGTLGTKHGLSPAKLFYVNRDSLDPSLQGDMPYLRHVYKDYHAYVKHHIDVAWSQQQLVTAQRNWLQREREKKLEKGNKNFSAQKDDLKPGTIVLVDRHYKPGVMSKLRPRGQARFVVVHTSGSCVYGRLWSQPDIERWASTKKYTQQNKDAVAKLPVIKIPKERCKKDTSIHMWCSNTNPADKQLMLLSQPDPEPINVEITTHTEDDWLDTATGTEDTEENPSDYFEHEPEIMDHETEEDTTRFIGAIKLSASILHTKKESVKRAAKHKYKKPQVGEKCKGTTKVKFSTKSSKIIYDQEQVEPNKNIIIEEVDTIFERNQTHLKRTYTYAKQNTLLAKHDNEVQGTYLTNRLGKIEWIKAEHAYNRHCGCKKCLKQLPKCRQLPCNQCIKI
jgi:hypothetical protein